MFVSSALAFCLLSGPHYRLSYEIEFVQINPETNTGYHHMLTRVEADATSGIARTTLDMDGTSSTYTETKSQIEQTGPDGTKQTWHVPAGKTQGLEEALKSGGAAAKPILDTLNQTRMGNPVETNETKTICGVLCRKTVTEGTVKGQRWEDINWNVVDKRYDGWSLPSLETYTYYWENGTRRLFTATTAASVKIGDQKPLTFNR